VKYMTMTNNMTISFKENFKVHSTKLLRISHALLRKTPEL